MEFIADLWNQYGHALLSFVVALLYLIGFYVVARIIRAVIRKLMGKTELDNRFMQTVGLKEDFPIEKVLAEAVFWVIMAFGLMTFFDQLQLDVVTQPINTLLTEVFRYLPKLAAAIGLLAVAWILAALVKLGIGKLAGLLKLDQRLNELDETKEKTTNVGQSLATAGYWFVFLMFLPMVLSTLNMESLVQPLQHMFSELFTFLPNILSAALIFIVGGFVARIVRQIVSSLLAAAGADNLSARAGMSQQLSTLVGALAYTVILLLVIVQSLDALQVAAISQPASLMIDMIFTAVPRIVSAVLVVAISWYVGKLVAGLVTDLLTAAGFNHINEKLGINIGWQRTPSEYAGSIVLLGIILFAVLGATELLGFEPLSSIVTIFIGFAVHVILAAVILAIGVFAAGKVHGLVKEAGMATAAANLARVAILVLATAMALRQLGLAEDIINMAFGIILGSLAVGAAIAIGLGSKDIAAREIEALVQKFKAP